MDRTDDGFYTEQPKPLSSSGTGSPGPRSKPQVLVKIPQRVIERCIGLAIFSVARTGLWISGAGGSGVLIARKEDGSWSPPSGILIHTLGVGFMAGIDIYDCVLVINDRQALNAFSKLRVSLGGEVSLAAGPVGVGGILDHELLRDRKPVWTYMKSRGLYGGIQFDGTIIIERNDENARFYGERLPVGQILAGNVRRVPPETRMLMEVVKEAEGRTDLDQVMLAEVYNQPVPGDVEVEQMTEPTAEQKMHYGPPQGYYAPEKTDYTQQGPAGYAPFPHGSYPTHPPYGAYQPPDYPPPPQPPRPSSSSYNPVIPQQGAYQLPQGSYPTHPPYGAYHPPDYPPPTQPPRPSSSSYGVANPQQGAYQPPQGHGAYWQNAYAPPNAPYQGTAPQGGSYQAPYFPPPPPH